MSILKSLYAGFKPKLFTVFEEGYSLTQFWKDLSAGVIVGIVALPLAIAFAIASGLKPEQGLYTAVIAGFLISALGGCRAQIGGPTGAFIVIVFGIVQKHGPEGLATATLMAGVLLVLMGLARLGSVIKFVPFPVTVGFTTGIALIIATSQIRDFFGLQMTSVPSDFIEKVHAYALHASTINWHAAGIGLMTIGIVVFWPKVTHRIPGSLVAIIVTTAAVSLLHLSAETIGDRFGGVPNSLPRPVLPDLRWSTIQELFSPALSIALLAGIESLLSAVVADGMLGTRHRSNVELVAQGLANIASPIFGGMPATGAIARTATNIKNGGRTPVAGIVHAITLLLIMLCFGEWAALIPMPALAGILIVVAYNMSEWRNFIGLFRTPRSDVLVLIVTFLLTVLLDLTVAIQAGMVLAAFLFMQRMASISQAGYVSGMMSDDEEAPNDPNAISLREVPDGVEVFEVYGAFFFGAVSKFKDAISLVEDEPRVLILRLREVFVMDATGLIVLEEIVHKSRSAGTHVILSGVHSQPLMAMDKAGLLGLIGQENTFRNIDEALLRARELLEETEPARQ